MFVCFKSKSQELVYANVGSTRTSSLALFCLNLLFKLNNMNVENL